MTSLLTYDQIAKNLQQVLDEKNPQAEKFEKMDYLFSNLLAYYTEPFLIPFNSLFAQLSFAIAQLKISKPESFILHYSNVQNPSGIVYNSSGQFSYPSGKKA